MQITISEVLKYIQCPRSFKLATIDGREPEHKSLSFCRSVTVKEVLKALHLTDNQMSRYSYEEIQSICQEIWQKQILDLKVNQDELCSFVVQPKAATKNKPVVHGVTKSERILENITKWVFEYSREESQAEVLYTGVYFQTQIADTTFVGYIDVVRKVNDTLQVLSISTASQPPEKGYIEQDFVLSLFSHVIRFGVLYPEYPCLENPITFQTLPEVYVYHMPFLERYQKKTGKHKKGERKGNPLISATRSEEELLKLEYEILYTVAGIKQEFFPKMPRNPVGCSMCQYANACRNNHIFGDQGDTSFEVEELEQQEAIA